MKTIRREIHHLNSDIRHIDDQIRDLDEYIQKCSLLGVDDYPFPAQKKDLAVEKDSLIQRRRRLYQEEVAHQLTQKNEEV